jgi:hypothetical protein
VAFKVIVRKHEGVQSYLVLDDHPRELLRHVGFYQEFSIRTWYGSLDAADAREEWAEMLGEDPYDGSYLIVESTFRDFVADAPLWAHCIPDKG